MADASPGTTDNVKNRTAHTIEVRDPDALQEKMISFWELVEKNSHIVVGLIALVIVAALGTTIWNWWTGRQEKAAQTAYYEVENKYTKLKEGFDRAKFKAMMPQMAKDEKTNDAPASGDLSKDYGTIPADLEKIARDHAKTTAGAQAAILAADLYMSYQKPEKAIEIAQVPAKTMNDKSLLANLAKMVWGTALANKGQCAEAVQIWQQVTSVASVGFLHGDAFLRSGLCYEALNDTNKAREMYQKVTTQGEDSTASATAKGLLRALELKSTPKTEGK